MLRIMGRGLMEVVRGHVIVLSMVMNGHLEQLINLFRFAVSVSSHRRIHFAWRYFKGDRMESATKAIADLAHRCIVASISRAKIGSGFSHCIFLGSLGSTPVPSRDAEGFSSQREERRRIEWEKDTPHPRYLVRLWKIERGDGEGKSERKIEREDTI